MEGAPSAAAVVARNDDSTAATEEKSINSPTSEIKEKGRTDQNDAFSVHVKPEFVLQDRHPSLPPLPERKVAEEDISNNSGGTGGKNGEEGDQGGKKGSRKKKKGINKKRPRDVRPPDQDKPCLSTIRGEECQFGKECKFNHNMKEMLANRQPDIAEIEGGCPIFQRKGFCEYGIMCRIGSTHINVSTGENFRKEESNNEEQQPVKPVMNVLCKNVQAQLRRKQYPFKCKRHFEKKKMPADKKEEDAPTKTIELEKSKLPADEKEEDADDKEEQATIVTIEPVKIEEGTTQKGGPETMEERRKNTGDEQQTDYSPLPSKRILIDFRNKVYVAPLTTVGNLPYRRIMKGFGADITCGEMAVASNLLEGKASEWALLKRHHTEDVFGVQIAAGYPDQFSRVCEILESQTTVDFVDLNMGCPLDMICNKGAGSSLMMREKRLKSCLRGINETLSCPFTLKMRTGWDMHKPFAHTLIPKIQKWNLDGISAYMIHGRSRLQRYSKLADWDYIAKVANSQSMDLPQLPVIGNGDIYSYTDYEEKIARNGVSTTAMLARGALIKPWLPTEIKERRHWDISASERLDMLKEFVRNGLEHWGSDQTGVNNTRRFLLEWLSFLNRYIPVGLLEVVPQQMNQRPPSHMCGRSDLETLMLSKHASDWVKISEMLLGPVPDNFRFEPKHKASGLSSFALVYKNDIAGVQCNRFTVNEYFSYTWQTISS